MSPGRTSLPTNPGGTVQYPPAHNTFTSNFKIIQSKLTYLFK